MTNPSDSKLSFDPERVITAYREVIRERDLTKTLEIKADLEIIAERLRAVWRHWRNADDLHQVTFGKPDDWLTEQSVAAGDSDKT